MRILRKLKVIQIEIEVTTAELTMKNRHAISAKKKNLKKYPLSVKHLKIMSITNQMRSIKVKILIGMSMILGKKYNFIESLIRR